MKRRHRPRYVASTFRGWVERQRITDDPTGDFVYDSIRKIRQGTMPRITAYEQLRRYLIGRGACEGAHEAGATMWTRYSGEPVAEPEPDCGDDGE